MLLVQPWLIIFFDNDLVTEAIRSAVVVIGQIRHMILMDLYSIDFACVI